MGNRTNWRFRRAQSPSLEKKISASEGNETIIETHRNFEHVSRVRCREPVLNDCT